MALHLVKPIGKNAKIGIWRIAEPVEELLRMRSFSSADLDKVAGFSKVSRKQEWLISRILIDKIIGTDNVSIYYDEYNKPFLKLPGKYISISHSYELQAVMADDKPVGVDIELIRPKIISIKNKFMNEDELAFLGEENQHEKLTLCWSIKEALYKQYGKKEITFKEHLKVYPFNYSSDGGIVSAGICIDDLNVLYALGYESIRVGENMYMLVYIVNEV